MNAAGNVEYYFNVLVDKEIPEEVIEELNISEKALATNASRMKLNRDLYTVDQAGISKPVPGGTTDEEPC